KSSAKSSANKYNKTQNSIIDLIMEDEQITQKDIAKKLTISDRAVRKAMVNLIENGVVIREGSSRKGKWIILNK
ncbi:MAG: winged helix-turn-helix transcriptional regulator, partial [Longicatena sp.]